MRISRLRVMQFLIVINQKDGSAHIHRYLRDIVPDSDKSEFLKNSREFPFESDVIPVSDEPGILFFESILLPEGCFFCVRENGDFRKWWFIFGHSSGGSGFFGWGSFLLCLLFVDSFFAEGRFFRGNVKNP